MTKSLTTLIANVQSLLLDDGTRFSTATATAAVRSALKDFNARAPYLAGELMDVVASQYEYNLNATAYASLIDVISVLKQGTDTYLDINTELPFDYYWENGGPMIRLRSPQSSGNLMIRYTIPHTVSGLDSETLSTLPAYWDNVLIDGSCYWACVIRALGRVEPINLNQRVPDTLHSAMAFYKQAFDLGLLQAARRKPAVSEPNKMAWNDSYHTSGDGNSYTVNV